MLDDDETVVRQPHAAIIQRKDGKTATRVIDPRTSATLQAQGTALTLLFDPADGQLLEVRLAPGRDGTFEPWRLMPKLPLYVQYARASIAGKNKDADRALSLLQQTNAPRRGLSDQFLREIAALHRSLIAEGERYPVKALARSRDVAISTASRWITAARTRGFLEADR